MATNRYISTSFWDDEWIQTLDSQEKLLYMYLLTNPLTTLAGVYRITIRRMSFDTRIEENIVSQSIKKFEEAKKVFLLGDWLILPNFPKHQTITPNDNIRKNVDSILRSIPENIFQFILSCGYTYIFLNELDRYQALHRSTAEASSQPLPSPLEGPSKPLARASNYINLNTKLNIKNKIKDPDGDPPPTTPLEPFKKPTLEEVRSYIRENGYSVNPDLFFNNYEAVGWKVGEADMKDWRAAVRKWSINNFSAKPKASQNPYKNIGSLEMKEAL